MQLGAAIAAASTDYDIVDLGTLGGPSSAAGAINDFGRVAGVAWDTNYAALGFQWDGVLTPISPLSGDLQCQGFDLNSSGVVVSVSYDLGEMTPHGLNWLGGITTPLGDLAPHSVNDSGVIVGYLSVNDPAFGWVDHAALWTSGVLVDLGTLGGHFSYAHAVASDGRVVGHSSLTDDSVSRAFLWQDGAFRDLGTLGGQRSQAFDINDFGDIVGCASDSSGADRAFLFATDASGEVTTRTDLGHLGNGTSYARALNNLQQVVGTSSSRAFLWDGEMRDLNAMIPTGTDWVLQSASDINDSGQIVGLGTYRGFPRAFLLNPLTPCDGDLDGDRDVDLSDLGIVLADWNCAAGPGLCAGDVDDDGDTDLSDLGVVLAAYGQPCP